MMFMRRCRHALNTVYCYVKEDCAIGKQGEIHEVAAGYARVHVKSTLVLPSLWILQRKEMGYKVLGYPVDEMKAFLETKREEKIKKLGVVVPEWTKLAEKLSQKDDPTVNN